MNVRYRKMQRLKSRHRRRGHSPWCRCPEPWQEFLIYFRRYHSERLAGRRRRG